VSETLLKVDVTISPNLKTLFYPGKMRLYGKLIDDKTFNLKIPFHGSPNSAVKREISIEEIIIRESGNILTAAYRETITYYNSTKINIEGKLILNKTTNIMETPPLDANSDQKLSYEEIVCRGANPSKVEFSELKDALDLFFENIKCEKSPVSFEVISKALNNYFEHKKKP
jgi:hypothetical protein